MSDPYWLIERNDRGKPEWMRWRRLPGFPRWTTDVHEADRYYWGVAANQDARRIGKQFGLELTATEHVDMAEDKLTCPCAKCREEEARIDTAPTVSDFDVAAEARVHCGEDCEGDCDLASEIADTLRRAIAHGRRQGAEEMRERAAMVCAGPAHARIRALPLPGDETEET